MSRWMAPPEALSRRWKSVAAAILAVVMLALATPPAWAESRFALVIGNGAYRNVPALANPPNDAKDIAAALKSLGFKVTLKRRSRPRRDAARDRGIRLGVGRRRRFAVLLRRTRPAGRRPQLPRAGRRRAAQARGHRDKDGRARPRARGAQARAKGVHLVFLDACRNNPFASAVALPAAGLARVGKLPGFLITFATQPDNVAFDGSGRNSPFAAALLGHLATPGADISSMMIAVRSDVFAATGGQQIPCENSSLTRQFYFAGSAGPRRRPRRSSGALPERTATRTCSRPISTAIPTDRTPPTSARFSRIGPPEAPFPAQGNPRADIEDAPLGGRPQRAPGEAGRALSRALPERRACR